MTIFLHVVKVVLDSNKTPVEPSNSALDSDVLVSGRSPSQLLTYYMPKQAWLLGVWLAIASPD